MGGMRPPTRVGSGCSEPYQNDRDGDSLDLLAGGHCAGNTGCCWQWASVVRPPRQSNSAQHNAIDDHDGNDSRFGMNDARRDVHTVGGG